MDYYVKRLTKCGYSPSEAEKIYLAAIEQDSIFKFISYLEKLEAKNVDRIQSESCFS